MVVVIVVVHRIDYENDNDNELSRDCCGAALAARRGAD